MVEGDAEDSQTAFCGIAVMAKASQPGRTKTRLVPPLTFAEAAAFNTAFLQDVAANIAAANCAAGGRAIDGYMAFGPPGSEAFFRDILPAGVGLIECWHPNFGNCLFSAVLQLFEHGHGGAVVLNADSPSLPTALLKEAAEVLASPGDRAVLGPAADGGYYLLGIKSPHRRLFEDVSWSTAAVADQTLARAAEIGLDVHILPSWYDVDDVAALHLLRSDLFDDFTSTPGLAPFHAAHSRSLFASLVNEAGLERRLLEARSGVVLSEEADLTMQRAAE